MYLFYQRHELLFRAISAFLRSPIQPRRLNGKLAILMRRILMVIWFHILLLTATGRGTRFRSRVRLFLGVFKLRYTYCMITSEEQCGLCCRLRNFLRNGNVKALEYWYSYVFCKRGTDFVSLFEIDKWDTVTLTEIVLAEKIYLQLFNNMVIFCKMRPANLSTSLQVHGWLALLDWNLPLSTMLLLPV